MLRRPEKLFSGRVRNTVLLQAVAGQLLDVTADERADDERSRDVEATVPVTCGVIGQAP